MTEAVKPQPEKQNGKLQPIVKPSQTALAAKKDTSEVQTAKPMAAVVQAASPKVINAEVKPKPKTTRTGAVASDLPQAEVSKAGKSSQENAGADDLPFRTDRVQGVSGTEKVSARNLKNRILASLGVLSKGEANADVITRCTGQCAFHNCSLSSWLKSLPGGVKRYLVVALLPSFLCFLYFALWASPMYVSEVKFAVKSADSGAGSMSLMTTLFRMPTSSLQDAMVVEEFLRSNDAFTIADDALNLIEHYSSSDHDLISRLASMPTVDDINSFWSSVSEVSVNQDSNVLTFRVRAYSPEMAYQINEQILNESEALVNSMNERAKEDMLKLADTEVVAAKDRLHQAQQDLQDFRKRHQDLDLKATAQGMQSLVLELESQAAQLRAQLSEQGRFTDPSAPSMQALRARLVGIEQQIERERAKLTAIPEQGASINALASQYENLMTEAEFARQQLVFAMTSLEQAKADILSKNLYIVTVAKPSLPDESLYPRPLLFTFYIFIGLSMAYAVISLVGAAIKEHMGY